jgi:hypothetical protein
MPDDSERRWAVVRIVLGQAQMIGAVVSLVCLLQTGMSALTSGAISITVACLVVSLVLFRKRDQEG